MINQDEKNSAAFLGVVLMFQAAAMQNMGKIKNPATDKIERQLDQAQYIIDILDMLVEKTKGNLNDDEQKFLSSVLQELKLNYVDEVNKNLSEPTQTQ